jgi:hypothetical protein
MQDNETCQDFKRRWDIAMINYMMVDCRTPREGQPGHHYYPHILEANLWGEAEFARQYPGRAVYKTNAWLHERIIRSFANVSEEVRQRYPAINMYASNAMTQRIIKLIRYSYRITINQEINRINDMITPRKINYLKRIFVNKDMHHKYHPRRPRKPNKFI